MGESYDQLFQEQVTRDARPVHPWWRAASDPRWTDPTAGELQGDQPLTKRERSMMGASGHYAIEGMLSMLTPLGFIALVEMCLRALLMRRDHPSLDVPDPFGELGAIPDEAIEQFDKAEWHLGEALKAMGLDGATGQAIPASTEPLPCGCPAGTHDASISEIGQHHEGNPWLVREMFEKALEEGTWKP